MATFADHFPALAKTPIVGILRRCPPERVVDVAATAAKGGLTAVEITFDSTDPVTQIGRTIEALPRLTVGAGTVLDAEQAKRAVEAGAAFVVSPVISTEVLEVCLGARVPYLPGAATPTEIWQAHRAGATAVKVFPARELGGPAYLSALRAPLEGIPLLPTGGVGIDDIADYLSAGAAAVGLGGTLFPKSLIEAGRLDELAVLVFQAVAAAG